MKKIIITIAALTVFILSAAIGYAYPGVTHMFYNDYDKRLYVFSQSDNNGDTYSDAGVYINGKKYSIVKEEEDKKKLAILNSSDEKRYGLAFENEVKFFDNLLITPYTVDEEGKELLGNSRKYDLVEKDINKEDVIYFDNFTAYSEDELPKAFRFSYTKNQDVSAKIVKEKDINGIEKNMLLLSDFSTAGVVSAKLNVPDYNENLYVEMRFKFVKQPETDGFGFWMVFSGNGNNAFRIMKYADNSTNGFTYETSSGGYNVSGKDLSGNPTELDGKWVTLRLRMDTKRYINQLIFENDFYKTADMNLTTAPYMWQNKADGSLLSYNLLSYNEFQEEKIDLINLQTYPKSYGQYYFDYIKLVSDVDEFKTKRTRAPSKPIETIPDPVENW